MMSKEQAAEIMMCCKEKGISVFDRRVSVADIGWSVCPDAFVRGDHWLGLLEEKD